MLFGLLLNCAFCVDDPDLPIGNAQDGPADPGPLLVIDPVELNLGLVPVGDTATGVVTLRNEGSADLHLDWISLVDDTGAWHVGSVGTNLVPPGGTTDFTVTFEPDTARPYPAVVQINSDATNTPVAEAYLTADGQAPIIDVTPQVYDFGDLYIGCEQLQLLTVSNVGNADLEVYSLDYTTGGLDLAFDPDLAANGALPWVLAPGAQTDVWVHYTSIDEFEDIGYLEIESNDPATQTFMATQTGRGSAFGENLDVFEQSTTEEVDILIAPSWASSMQDDVANVRSQLTTLVTDLAASGIDYRLAVVTEDDGCINGYQPYIEPTMSLADQADLLDTMLCEVPDGTDCDSKGNNTQRAFMLMEAALSTTNLGSGGCNEDFFRSDAALALVGISDRPETSVNTYTYYTSLFQSLKADADDVVIHGVGGDYPQGCGTNTAYTGMYEATIATGGLFLSICATDWGQDLVAVGDVATNGKTSFELTDFPVEDTLEVTVNGFIVSQGWTYNSIDNTIDFDTAPEPGSSIEVEYTLYGDCDG